MSFAERAGLKALQCLDPERAHRIAIRALQSSLMSTPGPITSDILKTKLAGLTLPNPLGLAAGFDKNAEALTPLTRAGFGFIEVGAVTPHPQVGNPKPRLFRLPEDQGVINRFGFNNDGMMRVGTRLAKRPTPGIIGLNLGANKDSPDRLSDYAMVLNHCAEWLDFATVNISSPNTEKLRDLQGAKALESLLEQVMKTRDALPRPIPVFLKIAPDLSDKELADIAAIASAAKVSAIIATNTTLDRHGLISAHRDQAGGLSGAPLFEKSTHVLAQLSNLTHGKMPLIGVGGISNADHAYDKIQAGAHAVQLYSALAYQGLSLTRRIISGLQELLERDGFENIQEAVGTKRKDWL